MSQKPEGVRLEFGKRADIQNVPANYDIEYIFENPKILYELERETIVKHIRTRLDELCNNDSKLKEFLQKIKDIYANDYEKEDATLIDEAIKENLFKQKLHSSTSIILSRVAFVGIILIEMILLIAIGLLQGGGFNPIIILYGFLILIGSFLVGNVLGNHFFKQELGRMGKFDRSYVMPPTEIAVKLSLGLVLILFVAASRAIGADSIGQIFGVFLLTVILALVAAVFEGMAYKFSKLNDWAISNQAKALRKYASYLHSISLKKSDNQETSEYERLIKSECQRASEDNGLGRN